VRFPLSPRIFTPDRYRRYEAITIQPRVVPSILELDRVEFDGSCGRQPCATADTNRYGTVRLILNAPSSYYAQILVKVFEKLRLTDLALHLMGK
jgi:hypothetical protein